jgi:uncharacterized coiled-coil protein SlyX
MPEPHGDEPSAGVDPATWLSGFHGPSHLTERDERILLLLFAQFQQLNERLTRLERRLDTAIQDTFTQPDQEDILELRLHSARLAAELSRVTVELRSEISELAAGAPPRPTNPPLLAVEDQDVIDLRQEGTRRRRRSSGWRPAQDT